MSAPMDLNILWSGNIQSLNASLQTAIKPFAGKSKGTSQSSLLYLRKMLCVGVGYETVALNYVIEDLLKCDKSKRKKSNAEAAVEIKKPDQILLPVPVGSINRCHQYSRFSTVIKTIDQTYKIQRCEEIQAFDLVAVTPTSEKTWQQACLTLDVDIISLDLTEKLPFNMKRQQINTAIERGIYFEINYSPAIRDATARRYIISNAQTLVSVSKGKNIIISSGGEKPMDLRGPEDVANLGELFGLNATQSKAAVTNNCKAAISHGQARKSSNSIITISKSTTLSTLQEEELETLRKLNVECNIESKEVDKEPARKKSKIK